MRSCAASQKPIVEWMPDNTSGPEHMQKDRLQSAKVRPRTAIERAPSLITCMLHTCICGLVTCRVIMDVCGRLRAATAVGRAGRARHVPPWAGGRVARRMAATTASCSRCLSTTSTTVVGTLDVCHGEFGLLCRRQRRLARGLRRYVCLLREPCRPLVALAGRGEALLGVKAAFRH